MISRGDDREPLQRSFRDAVRGQSEVLGVVLLLGITITGATAVVALGSATLSDSQQQADIGRAEHVMTQLDSQASLVGHGEAESRRVAVPTEREATTRVDPDAGWMRVEIRNQVTGETEDVLLEESLGAVVYENGDTTVAYQGGGVWKQRGGGSTMVSPPEFHYRGTTLTLPLIVVDGDASGERITVKKAAPSDARYPVEANSERSNPLTGAVVTVTVQSEYYQAWGRFFEQRTGGDVDVDHDDRTATITLEPPDTRPAVSEAVASTSSEQMVISGQGGSSFTDSYYSSFGPYSESQSEHGSIRTVGGVDMGGGAQVQGDLVTGGGDIKVRGSSTEITGNLSYGGSEPDCNGASGGHEDCEQVQGWVADNGSVPPIDPVDGVIRMRRESIDESWETRTSDEIDGAEIGAGAYHVEEDLDLSEGATFDLNDGDIVLYVDGTISMRDADIDIINAEDNEHRVEFYMAGSDVAIREGTTVSVHNDTAHRFWIYGPPDTDIEVRNSGTRFVGVLYAPDSDSRTGTALITSDAEVFGSVVAGEMTLQAGGSVHYDQRLREVEAIRDSEIPRVTYLHVTVNRVEIE